ncbi:hypothetical protein [Arthrobacter sp. UYCo732]|uniref:hypothetical protein n=1 Tax=Arthrobacter sp. UYCo732 TaxID=3156336 RepID=UPI0033910823
MSTAPETPKAECLCEECERPMRPRGVLLKEMPGTLAWGHSGKCKSCVQPHKTVERPAKPVFVIEDPVREDGSPDFHLALAVSSLNSFIAARRRRLGTLASKPVTSLEAADQRRTAAAVRTTAQPRRKAA